MSIPISTYAVNTKCGLDYNSYLNNYGGSHSFIPSTDVFAALKTDGSITTWGDTDTGGSGAPTDAGYISIASNQYAFAAMKADGSITVWGDRRWGGSGAPIGTGYISIASTGKAFAAMKADGSITAWGDTDTGGRGAPTDTGYTSIASNYSAFAAMKADGSIIAWGDTDISGAPTDTGYTSIASNHYAFAAMKADGSITAWGYKQWRESGAPTDTGYTSIASNHYAFAAMKADGSITAWGYNPWGGSGAPTDTGYISIASNQYAFAALKANGSITVWGNSSNGGSGAPTDTGYISIASTRTAFAAMKADGSITTWGAIYTGRSGEPTDTSYISINGVGSNTSKNCSFKREDPKLSISDSNRLFDCAEQAFPSLFNPADEDTFKLDEYWVRYYSNTDTYVGTTGADAYVYGDVFGGLLHVGQISDLIQAICPDSVGSTGAVVVSDELAESCIGEYSKQPSYQRNCLDRPQGTVCLGFSDSYTWLIHDSVSGWDTRSCNQRTVVVAIGFKGEYHHIIGTNLIKFSLFK